MPGVLLWAWDKDAGEWKKVLVDTDGKLIISDVDPFEIIQDTPQDLKHVPHGYHEATTTYKPFAVDADGKLLMLSTPTAHKDSHDPEDGSDPLDTAIAVKVGDANAIGTSHSLARADHIHEKHHAKYTDAEAVDAMGAIGDDNPLHHDKYTDVEAVAAVKADAGLPTVTITFIIDGGGEAITTGEKGHLRIPFACTINRVTMMADVSGSIVVDIWKDTYANFPPTVVDTITAAAKPTITTAQKSEDSTLTGWTTAITAGDILAFNVDSCATITRVTLSLKVTKT